VKEYEKRSQVLYFLASIAMVDGEIVSTELAFMKEIARLLNLNDDELDRILNTHFYSENKKKIDNKSISSSTLLISAFKVLGLEKGVSIEQVKSSYRKLAMIHHPDKFSTESEAQQKIAHERFVKINDAYEYVLKSF
jgi:DnaJ like chaperone protein